MGKKKLVRCLWVVLLVLVGAGSEVSAKMWVQKVLPPEPGSLKSSGVKRSYRIDKPLRFTVYNLTKHDQRIKVIIEEIDSEANEKVVVDSLFQKSKRANDWRFIPVRSQGHKVIK